MKMLLFVLMFCFTFLSQMNANSQTTQISKNGSLQGVQPCIPYTAPVTSSAVACGAGYTGMKYFTTTQTCPDAKITTSREYDTSNCFPIKTPTGPRCDLNPDACAGTPEAHPCEPGKHWYLPTALQGMGVAHCVKDDFVCPTGSKLVHDSNGEPSCQVITCPSNQVVQPDGSCGCPSNLPNWDGVTCSNPAPACSNYTVTQNNSCPSGQTGVSQQENTFDCTGRLLSSVGTIYTCTNTAPTCTASVTNETAACSDGSAGTMNRTRYVDCPGSVVSYSNWGMSGCAGSGGACIPTSFTNTAACDTGFVGNKTRVVSTTCPDGAVAYGDWNTSSCILSSLNGSSCTPSTGQEADLCPAGFMGYKYRTVNRLCPSGATYGGWDLSSCVRIPTNDEKPVAGCTNGGTDYPTCTLPIQVCFKFYYSGLYYWVYGWGLGSDFSTPGNSPYNQATGLSGWNTCTPSAWDIANSG